MRAWPFLVAVVAVGVACSSFEPGDEPPATTDASVPPPVDAGTETDAAAPSDGSTKPACNPTAAFGPARALTELNSAGYENAPRLTADERTIYFTSSRGAGTHVYTAKRAKADLPFDAPVLLESIKSNVDDADPWISEDDLTIYFSSTRATGAFLDFDIFRASRANTSEAFGGAVRLVGAVGVLDTVPTLDSTQTSAFFFSSRDGDGGPGSNKQIYGFSVTGDAGTGTLVALGDPKDEKSHPLLSADGRRMYMSLNRNLSFEWQIAYSDRTSTADPFGAPTVITELSQQGVEDRPGWISPDGCRFYLSRGSGVSFDLYVAERGN